MHEVIVQRRIVVVFKHNSIYATAVDHVGDLRATAGFNLESGSPVPSDPTGVHRISDPGFGCEFQGLFHICAPPK